MCRAAGEHDFDLKEYEFLATSSNAAAANIAVALVRAGKVESLMKGAFIPKR